MQNNTPLPFQIVHVVAGLATLAGIYLTSLYNYLLFHGIAEIFSIAVAAGIFMLTWNARRFMNNNYLVVLGVAHVFIAILDSIHTLSYTGMNIFIGFGANLPTQLWIAARYLESVSYVVAPFFFSRKINHGLLFSGYLAATAILLLMILPLDIFPDCFRDGIGLTPFKKISEYAIALILTASLGLLFRHRDKFDVRVLRLLTLSVTATIASELLFTLYSDPYGPSNLFGHLLKIVSFYFVYKAIIETGLVKPYDLLFKSLSGQKAESEAMNVRLKREIEDRKQIEKSLEKKQIRLGLMNSISTRIISDFSVVELIRHTVTRIFSYYPQYRAAYSTIGSDGKLEVLFSAQPDTMPDITGLTADLSVAGDYLADLLGSEPVIMADIWDDKRIAPLAEAMSAGKTQAVLDIPMVYSDELVGLICFDSPVPTEWTEDEIQTLREVADYLAIAIGDARMRNEREEAAKALKKAHDNLESEVRKRTRELVDANNRLKSEIEERIRAQNAFREKQARLAHTGRLASLGEMASGVAHELNQPLSIIRLDAESLKFTLKKNERLDESSEQDLDSIIRSVDRAAEIIRHMRGFAKKKRDLKQTTSLSESVESGLVFFKQQFRHHGITLETDLDGDLPRVPAETQQIEQIIVNLVSNARYAVDTRAESETGTYEKQIVIRGYCPETGNAVVLEVRDNGTGMTPGEKERAIEPFFTAKKIGEGTGLGLSVVHGNVMEIGGKLEIDTEQGNGTTIRIVLPVADW